MARGQRARRRCAPRRRPSKSSAGAGRRPRYDRRRPCAGSTSWPSGAGRRPRGRASTAAVGCRRRRRRSSPRRWPRSRFAPPLIGFGLSMIGPLLLQEGSEALQREHLPPIVRGEIRWCQGYSEPSAGSRPREPADQGRRATATTTSSNGQKIWTSYGDKSDWMFLLVRTDSTRAQARRDHLPPARHDDAGRQRAAHPPHQRRVAVLRDVLHRRAHPREERRRAGATAAGQSPAPCSATSAR